MRFLILLFCFAFFKSYAQSDNINNYKYIIVNKQFNFLKEPDQYQTSSLLKFLLAKRGFEVYLENEELPDEIKNDRCNALKGNVEEESGMLTLKVKIELRDCNNNLLYESKVGKSRIKEYRRGYQSAIKDAYNKMTDLKYSYTPLSKAKVKKDIIIEDKKPAIKKEELIDEKETITNKNPIKNSSILKVSSKPIQNGYQLLNVDGEIVFTILKTSNATTFILKDKNGILFRGIRNWIAEYYENGVKITKKLDVNF